MLFVMRYEISMALVKALKKIITIIIDKVKII